MISDYLILFQVTKVRIIKEVTIQDIISRRWFLVHGQGDTALRTIIINGIRNISKRIITTSSNTGEIIIKIHNIIVMVRSIINNGIILLTTKGIVVKVGEVGEEDGDGQRRPFSIFD